MMLSLPSARKLIYSGVLLLLTLATIHLLLRFDVPSSEEAKIHILQQASPARTDLRAFNTTDTAIPLHESFVSHYHKSHPLQPIHPQVIDLLTKCKHKANPITNHIRLKHITFLNISMIPSKEAGPEFHNKKYFNPAILPLPAHATTATGHTYLLVSRLVTDGHHQESHICFADLCLPDPASGSRECTKEDLELLGPSGGLRCVTKPEQLNIAPTPARRCTGAWSTFPDIPGFHDPRVFWSGNGEPLVEVNSGSMYGCIGLWLVDLRSVFPVLDTVSRKSGKGKSVVSRNERNEKAQQLDMLAHGPRMQYKYLTEITRNPRSSRNEIEKNWVMFFPSEEEAWVQYNMMGQIEGAAAEEKPYNVHMSSASLTNTLEVATVAVDDYSNSAIVDAAIDVSEVTTFDGTAAAAEKPTVNSPAVVVPVTESPSYTELPKSRTPQNERPPTLETDTDLRKLLVEDGPAKRAVELVDGTANQDEDTTSVGTVLSGGRSLAQLIAHGYTTPNLTHHLEPSCFDFANPMLLKDNLNNPGHWHQGSNSLRLILCTREALRSRSCVKDLRSQHAMLDRDAYEAELRSQGLVVHFSIVHRKFSNAWKLPMRYERYLLLWEARRPYRMLGISRYPILFGNERAHPWSWVDDLGQERAEADLARRQEEEDGFAYFTYTPSIAWSWRSRGEDEGQSLRRGHDDLGTGYLDDSIIVGIGMDDRKQGLVQVKLEDVLGCLRLCPNLEEHKEAVTRY